MLDDLVARRAEVRISNFACVRNEYICPCPLMMWSFPEPMKFGAWAPVRPWSATTRSILVGHAGSTPKFPQRGPVSQRSGPWASVFEAALRSLSLSLSHNAPRTRTRSLLEFLRNMMRGWLPGVLRGGGGGIPHNAAHSGMWLCGKWRMPRALPAGAPSALGATSSHNAFANRSQRILKSRCNSAKYAAFRNAPALNRESVFAQNPT